MPRPISTTLQALEAHGCQLSREGEGWRTSCPSPAHAHGNKRNPALTISEAADGTVLLHCHAGCDTAAVLQAIGLNVRDLFPPADKPARKPVRSAPPDGVDGVTRFTYTDETGRPVIYVTRQDTPGGKRIRQWGRGPDGKCWIPSLKYAPKPRPLYHLPEVLDADLVVIHEGEKAAVAASKARLHGVHTTTIGGAGNARHSDFAPLRGRDVVVVPDNDAPGEKHAEQVAQLAHEAGARTVRILRLPNLPEKGDVVEWLAAGGTDEQWRELIAQAEVCTPEKPRPKVVAVGIADFLAMEIPTRGMIVSPWLPTQGLAMIYGFRGMGKTHVSLGLAVAVASGGRFLKWEAPAAKGVLFIDGEMPAKLLQERLADIIVKAEKEPTAPLQIITPDLQEFGMPNLADPEGQANIEPYLDGINLIILDNISTLCRGGRENEAESWLPVQEWALRMRARGFSILFIHHSGKAGQQRGTSKREDVLDTVISLRRPADYTPDKGACFEVHYEKARGCYGDDVKPFEAMLTPHGWTMKDLEQSLTEKVAALLNDGVPQNEIADMLGVTKGCVSKHKKKAAALGLLLRVVA